MIVIYILCIIFAVCHEKKQEMKPVERPKLKDFSKPWTQEDREVFWGKNYKPKDWSK